MLHRASVGWALLAAGSVAAGLSADTRPTLPEALTENEVIAFVMGQNISTVEEFVEVLPPLHKKFYIGVHSSSSPSADFVSPTHPRIVSWGAGGRFIMTWTTNRADPNADMVEFLQPVPDEERWIAGAIDFSGGSPVLRHPASCSQCHGPLNRPLWGANSVHEGTEEDGPVAEPSAARTLHLAMRDTDDPRLTPLDRSGYNEHNVRHILKGHGDPESTNWDLAQALTLRHSQVLFQRLRGRHDYEVEALLCESRPSTEEMLAALGRQFSQRDVNLRLLSDTLEPIQGRNSRADSQPFNYKGGSTTIQTALAFQLLYDAWASSPEVRLAYATTPNDRALAHVDESIEGSLLVFPAGASTAEAELLAAYREFFELEGQSFIDAQRERHTDSRYLASFLTHHVHAFHRCVCSALRGRVPDDCGASSSPAGGGGGGGGGGFPPPGDVDEDGDEDADVDKAEDEDDDDGSGGPRVPPTAAFELSAECASGLCRALTGAAVTLTDTSAGSVLSRSWELGDGTASRNQVVDHVWSEPGFYTVTLRVSDGVVESTASEVFLVEASDPAGTCVADDETLCLRDSRYSVRAQWRAHDGRSGSGAVVHEGTNESGLFRFFDRDNWEVVIKVLDGCAVNGSVWVFGASSTNLGSLIRVTDTVTDTVREYRNEPGRPAPAITDGRAFPEGCR